MLEKIRKDAWNYLTVFGPCQIFLTMSAPDLQDPCVCMQADPTLNLEEALKLSSAERGERLAKNPAAAAKIFQRRIDALLLSFLLGNAKPFGEIRACLGRIEQQKRCSPHLHLLLWAERRAPDVSAANCSSCAKEQLCNSISDFIELYSAARLPFNGNLFEEKPDASSEQKMPLPIAKCNYKEAFDSLRPNAKSCQHRAIGEELNAKIMDGSSGSNRKLAKQMLVTSHHSCGSHCQNEKAQCEFFFPRFPQKRGALALSSKNAANARLISLTPRSNARASAAHPLLAAMLRASADASVIFGDGVKQSSCVLSRGMKAEKEKLLDLHGFRKLQRMDEKIENHF